MPAGIQVYNDDFVFQIDETTVCLGLVEKGTVALNQPVLYGSGNNSYYRDITYAGVAGSTPIIAVRSFDATLVFGTLSVTRSGNDWTFRIIGSAASTANFNLQYFIFDRPRPMSSGAGMEVYLDDGTLQFSTAYPPLRIVAVKREADVLTIGGTMAIVAAAGFTSEERVETEDGQTFFFSWSYTATGQTIGGGQISGATRLINAQSGNGTATLPYGPPQGFAVAGLVFIVDVAGL